MKLFVLTISIVAVALGQNKTPVWPPKGFPAPVNDHALNTFIRADVLEYRTDKTGGDFRWDAESWVGGDYNRIWFKSEGERNTALKADYDIDFQILYGRFVRRYFDFQLGTRIETQTYQGRAVTRAHAAIGVEGLIPYRFEIEPTLFISQNGDVSGRFTILRDYSITQRLILQPRFETTIAAQRVERFTTGSGLNNIEAGFRLRYDIRRKFSPYVGVSFDRSFFGTAALVRREGGDPSQIRFVAGVRLWY